MHGSRICRSGRVDSSLLWVRVEVDDGVESLFSSAPPPRAFAFVVALGAPVLTAVHVGKDSLLSPLQSYLLPLYHGVSEAGQELIQLSIDLSSAFEVEFDSRVHL